MFFSNMHWHYWCAKLIKIRRDLYSVSTLLIIIHVTTLGSSLTFELIFLIFKMGIMLHHVHVVPSAWECLSPFFHPIYLYQRTPAHPSKTCSMSCLFSGALSHPRPWREGLKTVLQRNHNSLSISLLFSIFLKNYFLC